MLNCQEGRMQASVEVMTTAHLRDQRSYCTLLLPILYKACSRHPRQCWCLSPSGFYVQASSEACTSDAVNQRTES